MQRPRRGGGDVIFKIQRPMAAADGIDELRPAALRARC